MIKFNANNLQILNIGSLLIAFVLPTIILLSLPGILIDSFILISFISSALLLVITLENTNPLKITFLPTVVLLLTTFRLLLSIATTRNIIANEDVGNVIEIVGDIVLGGNLISGLLIFIIITIVQFMVVTKGGERVAEVGARFSLDALPGKQMTIDGDLKSGLISPEEAQTLRDNLTTENKLFGSLDGAMKFIKGDSIAGILISLVNLFGGIYVGINQFNLSLADSLHKFSVLTIGDGLVSQIPSLLLSLACGVYLTRIKGDNEKKSGSGSFIDQLFDQIKGFWKSLLVVSLIVMSFGFLNQVLFYVTVPISIIFIVLSIILYHKNKSFVIEEKEEGLGVFKNLKFIFRKNEYKSLIHNEKNNVTNIIWQEDVGTPFLEINSSLKCDLEVYISNILVYSFSHSNITELVEINNDEVFMYSTELKENLKNITNYFLKVCLINKYNLQYTDNILKNLEKESEVIKNEIDAAIGVNRVHDIIKDMIRSPSFYLDRVTFFESMIYWSRVENEAKLWFVRIRPQAKYEITSKLINSQGKINIILLTPEQVEYIESIFDQESSLDQQLEIKANFRSEIIRIITKFKEKPIIIVNSNELLPALYFFNQIMSTINVVSHDEISSQDIIDKTEQINTN